jgi:hydroxyethylthiazole kinase-like uncharacterized protein yjeF
MRALDSWAIRERGVDGLELMERAGAEVARAVERLHADGPVTVLCGKGNNGGDGLVVARLLRDAGRRVTVICTSSPDDFQGDAQANLERLPGPAPVAWDGADGHWRAATQEGLGVVVDALLGTGFGGEPHGAVAEAIDAINAGGAPVMSVDVPSGVDASNGVVAGSAVNATVTVTFHAAKPGLWIRPGKGMAGEVQTVDIGIPRGAPQSASIGLIADSIAELLPLRGAASTKFSSGHVLVVGGSPGLSGAPVLAARASMRAGAGYVTTCVPQSLEVLTAMRGTPEMMTVGLPDADGTLTVAGVERVLTASARGGAIVLGSGIGRTDEAAWFARTLAGEVSLAMVLDADGLNAYAGRLEDLATRQAPTVLTPHAGEMGRLLQLESSEVERERLHHVRDAAERSSAVVVLKGDDTLVATPQGTVAVSPGGSPALATAGTGDALAGVIAALLSQGLEPFPAAAAGVWLHAQAGKLAALRVGAAEGVLAGDVIAALPAARAWGSDSDGADV